MTSSSRPSSPLRRHRRCPCLPISLLSLVALLLLVGVSSHRKSSEYGPRFSVIIDAGSSGSRIHVYAYTDGSAFPPPLDLDRTAVMRVTPGLSAYAAEPARAGESLAELIAFAKEKVGTESWGETEVRLMATAGMRLVEAAEREGILESCRKVLRASGFRFEDDWATVIPGTR